MIDNRWYLCVPDKAARPALLKWRSGQLTDFSRDHLKYYVRLENCFLLSLTESFFKALQRAAAFGLSFAKFLVSVVAFIVTTAISLVLLARTFSDGNLWLVMNIYGIL